MTTWTSRAAMLIAATLASAWIFSAPSAAFQPFVSRASTPYHWTATITWQVDSNAPQIAHDSLAKAFQSWSDATGGALQSKEGPGGITLHWDTTGTKIPDPLYLAYTTFTADNAGEITGGNVIVNAVNYTWHNGGYGGVGAVAPDGTRDANLDACILHEIGHALGLDHSDKNPATIVGAIVPGNPPTMNSILYAGAGTLHDDDIAGIRTLYPLSADVPAPSMLTVTATPPSGTRKPLQVSFNQVGGDGATTWNFGDGSTSQGNAAQHTFTANGTYTVTVDCRGTRTTTTILVGNQAIQQSKAAAAKAAKAAKAAAKVAAKAKMARK